MGTSFQARHAQERNILVTLASWRAEITITWTEVVRSSVLKRVHSASRQVAVSVSMTWVAAVTNPDRIARVFVAAMLRRTAMVFAAEMPWTLAAAAEMLVPADVTI